MTLGNTAQMGPLLRREVEKQLLADLVHYGVDEPGLRINWSDACQEGHCTQALDGNLEGMHRERRSERVEHGGRPWLGQFTDEPDREVQVLWRDPSKARVDPGIGEGPDGRVLERSGRPISFVRFLAVGLPMTLVSLLVATVYLLLFQL